MMCNNESRLPGDPECSSDEEIDEWMKGKNVRFKILDKQIDFSRAKIKDGQFSYQYMP